MSERETIPCTDCARPTIYTGTKLCDPCWEARNRLPGMAKTLDAWKARAEKAEAALNSSLKAGLSHEELEMACANFGIDLTCGACASQFFTSYGGYEHEATCKTQNAQEWKIRYGGYEHEATCKTQNAQEWKTRATQAEAQVASMLEGASKWRERPCPRGAHAPCACCGEASDHMPDDEYANAGRTLLAELEALRELEQRVRKRCDEAVPQWGTELREALAAVDAARKGE